MSRKVTLFTIAAVIVLMQTLWSGAPAHAAPPADTPVQLLNPQFNPDWTKRPDVCGSGKTLEEVQVPLGWEPYWACQQPGDPANLNRTPEFRMVDMTFAYRVHSPNTALRYFNFWARNQSAGVYQVVPNVPRGSRLRFSLWVQLWTSEADIDPPLSVVPGNLEARVCIDTLGRTGTPNFADADIVCSNWARPWDVYAQLSVEATAKNSAITVILNSRAEFAVKHNDVHADDAELFIVNAPAPQPAQPAPAQTQPAQATAATAPKPTVTTTAITPIVREPADGARLVFRSRVGRALTVRGVSADGNWWRVLTGVAATPLGWVRADGVSADEAANALKQATTAYLIVAVASTPLQAAPNVSARRIAIARSGAQLDVIGKSPDGNWWQVRSDSAPDNAAWVRAINVIASAPASAK